MKKVVFSFAFSLRQAMVTKHLSKAKFGWVDRIALYDHGKVLFPFQILKTRVYLQHGGAQVLSLSLHSRCLRAHIQGMCTYKYHFFTNEYE